MWGGDNRLRYTSNKRYLDYVRMLKTKFPTYSICIYSQGKIDDFKEIALDNVHFFLDGDIKKTFHDLVTAKILVTSKSSFSYSAALLSTGTVYHLPFWAKPLGHWNTLIRTGIWHSLLDHYSYLLTMFDLKTRRFARNHPLLAKPANRLLLLLYFLDLDQR